MAQATLLLNEVKPATAKADGSATFIFRSPPLGTTWQGSLSIPTAPPSAQFTAALASTVWGSWAGISPFGPLQCVNGQDVTITASGLVPGTNYNAYFLGISSLTPLAPPTGPLPNASVTSGVTGQIQLGKGTVTFGAPMSFVVTVQPVWRSLWIAMQFNGNVSNVIGNQSGIHYSPFSPPYFADGTMTRYAMVEGVDTSVTVSVQSGSGTVTYWYGADLADIDEAVYPDSGLNFTIANPFNGSDQTIPLDVVAYGGLVHFTSGTIANGATWAALPAPTLGQTYRIHRWTQATTLGVPPTGPSVLTALSTAVILGGIPTGQYVDDMDGLLVTDGVNVVNETGANAVYSMMVDAVNLPHMLNF